MGKKQFIDKKNARVFRLVDRSVKEGDAVEYDEEGNRLPDRVFAEVTPGAYDDEEEDEEDGEDGLVDVGSRGPCLYLKYVLVIYVLIISLSAEERAGEAAKYGIFFDDRQYDYTQHLKPIGQTPGAVFVAAPATTIEHDDLTGEAKDIDPMAAEQALNRATYERIKETDADPAVLEVLEALDDDAFLDEDAFEDDFVVKLDREEVRVLAPMENARRRGKVSATSTSTLDQDFQQILTMYDDDLEDDEDLEEYTDDDSCYYSCDDGSSVGSSESLDVEDLDDAIPFSRGGPSRMYQVDEVRRELRDGDQSLLNRILFTTDDDDEADGADAKAAAVKEKVVLEMDGACLVGYNCLTAREFLSRHSRKSEGPKLIREERIKPIRISSKTGLPLPDQPDTDTASASADEQQEEDGQEQRENKGKARSKEETAEEKRARKAAVKEERRSRRAAKKTLAV